MSELTDAPKKLFLPRVDKELDAYREEEGDDSVNDTVQKVRQKYQGEIGL